MKAKQLKEILDTVDPERVVVLSIDPEGNGFREVKGYSDEYAFDGE